MDHLQKGLSLKCNGPRKLPPGTRQTEHILGYVSVQFLFVIIAKTLAEGFERVGSSFFSFISSLFGLFSSFLSGFFDRLSSFLSSFGRVFSNLFGRVRSVFSSFLNGVLSFFSFSFFSASAKPEGDQHE